MLANFQLCERQSNQSHYLSIYFADQKQGKNIYSSLGSDQQNRSIINEIDLTSFVIITPNQSGFRQSDSNIKQLLFLYNDFLKAEDAKYRN